MEWLETIDPKLFALEERPNFPLPAFPWKSVEEALAHLFAKSDLHLKYKSGGWQKKEELLSVQSQIYPLTLFASPLEKPLIFYMGKEDLRILAETLFEQEEAISYFLEPPILEGFYDFFMLTLVREIDKLSFAENLSFRLGEKVDNLQQALQEEAFFVLDLTLEIGSKKAQGRLLVPASFNTLWKKHFVTSSSPFSLNPQLQKKIAVEIALELGHVELPVENFKKITVGDLVILDHATYDPNLQQGFLVFTVNQETIFRGKIQENGIKILEYPRLEEVEKNIEEFEMDGSFEEESLVEEHSENSSPDSLEEKSLPMEKLPLQLVVEVGRLKMSLEELNQLTVGNIIETQVSLEQGVDLVVQGKRVGKGELVKLGEMLAVRITKI